MDYEILEYKNLWITICISTITLTVLFIVTTKEIKFTKLVDYFTTLSLAGMMLCLFIRINTLYPIASLTNLNQKLFSTEVIDKEISSGKQQVNYLALKPGDREPKQNE